MRDLVASVSLVLIPLAHALGPTLGYTADAPQHRPIAHLELLGEVRLPSTDLDGVPLGGLSGLTYDPERDLFYAVSDDRAERGPARFYTLEIDLGDGRLETEDVRILGTTALVLADGHAFAAGSLDPEAIAWTPHGDLIIASEGDARVELPPFLRRFGLDGRMRSDLPLPRRYRPRKDGQSGVRYNLALESGAAEPRGEYLFSATENALSQDGPVSTLSAPSPGRILVYDLAARELVREHLYWIDPIAEAPRPVDAFATAGLVELVALDRDHLLALERSFSVGRGNDVRLYEVDLTEADDILDLPEFSRIDLAAIQPASKRLLLHVDRLGVQPDNLEGMTFGPDLPDGRRTLLLISDDNFNRERQVTQILAFALDGKWRTVTEIQGRSHRSPLEGDWVRRVEGVVTAIDHEPRSQGFWFEAASSAGVMAPGLFVSTGSLGPGMPTVRIGDRVAVDGAVLEVGREGELTVTRIDAARIEILASGSPPNPLQLGTATPPPVVIDDDDLQSFDPCCDAIDYFENLEGRLVEVDGAAVVGATTRYGEITVVANGGRQGAARTAAGGVRLRPGDPNPDRITIDDRLTDGAPRVSVGQRFAAPIRGVVDYAFGTFRIAATGWPEVAREPSPSRSDRTATHRGGSSDEGLTLATYNVLNLDLSDGKEAYRRLARSILDDLGAPSLIGLQEIQDDDGPEASQIVTALENLTTLVVAIVDEGGPRYVALELDPERDAEGGEPHGNIRVAWLYDPTRIDLTTRGWGLGAYDGSDPDLEARLELGRDGRPSDGQPSDGQPRLGRSPARLGIGSAAFDGDPERGWDGGRKCLVSEGYALSANRERASEPLFLINCHLKSKYGDDRLFGPIQPPLPRTEEQRTAQTRLLRRFVESILAVDPAARIVLLGDMNEHEFRPPMRLLEGPLVNLLERVPPEERYTYNYQGNSQVLDHVLVSRALAERVRSVRIPHVNADRPHDRRASDHDPIVVRLDLE